MKTPEEILQKYIIQPQSKRAVVSCYKLVHFDDAIEAMKSYAREACVKFAKHITEKDSPYAICYGEITPFVTNEADFTCEEVVDNFLSLALSILLISCI